MRFWIAGMTLALLFGCGGSKEEEYGPGTAWPEGLTATRDQPGFVRLQWSMGPGTEPRLLFVLRDGDVIGQLPPGTRSFEDDEAGAPELAVTGLEADPQIMGVALSWTVVERPGPTHTYKILAVGRGVERNSEPAEGARAAPGSMGFTVVRDGEVLAEVPPSGRSFHDKEYGMGPAPLLRATGTSTSVELSWDDIVPSSTVGTYTYEVRGRWADGTAATAGPLVVEPNLASPQAFLIHRDGVLVAELPVDSRGYEDEGATPGRVFAPGLSIQSETVQAVELTWSAPPVQAGPTHRYELGVRWEGDATSTSEAAIARREAPVVVAFEIRRDGVAIGEVGGDATAFEDESAEPGSILPLALTTRARGEGVALSWGVGTGQRGRAHRYQVRAIPDGGDPAASSEVQGARGAPTALGFTLRRDGEPIATLEAEQREFLDTGAGPPTSFGMPLLIASLKTPFNTEGVWLRWTEPVGQATSHLYEIRVLSEVGPGEPVATTGARRAVPDGYEFQRDDGTWVAVEPETVEDELFGYMDTDAPKGQIQVTVSVDTHPVLWDAYFTSQATVVPPAPSAYRVRAVAGDVKGMPSEVATARRRPGDVLTYQWQRSFSGEESDFRDLPFQTRSSGFDEVPPDQTSRYYRVKADTAGAEGISPPVLAEAETFDRIAAFNEFTCAIRAGDGKRRCWGGSNAYGQAPVEPSVDSFDHIALGENFGCGIRAGDRKRICWGNNQYGQAPAGPSDAAYRHLDASYGYACGIREPDGRIECWGQLEHGQAPGESTIDSFTSLSTGMFHMCAIRESDHKVLCWGDNQFGRAPPGPSEDSFLQITSSKQATCGVRLGDRKVICWGNGLYGEAPEGPSEEAYESVAAGDMHMCGVRLADGHVQCWGMDFNCESSNYQVSLFPFSAAAGGFNHSCGILRDDGRIVCWGLNRSGQAPRGFSAFPPATCHQ